MNLILGAGLAGLSASYHIGHDRCLVLEKSTYPFGHLHVEFRGGFTWDQGPHVSFTKHDYVKSLFADGVDGDFDEYDVQTANYYRGDWIDHPAQSSLYQVPEPLRTQCLKSFLESRNLASLASPANYQEWLDVAFGPVFAREFSAAYTRKYWTRDPAAMTTDWVGGRVFSPKVEDVVSGSKGPLGRQTHYVTKVRYPRRGGYQSFARKIAAGSQVKLGAKVVRIDLSNRQVWTASGECFAYTRLINTLPLPVFVELCAQATPEVIDAARQLSCSQLLLVNVTAPHPTRRRENWMYVYDEDKYSTRINCTERLTAGNGPSGSTGVQVEVYYSRHRPLREKPDEVATAVKSELAEMELIDPAALDSGQVSHFTVDAPWANVIFDHQTRPALEQIWSWLEQFGLSREGDDLNPLTDWGRLDDNKQCFGTLIFAGRFGQWKYFWTDDCVLRARMLAQPK
jgi:protoporphyrinogen oxidase